MRAILVVVANILGEQAFQVAFVNCNDVIQEITTATPYPTLCDSILPRTLERSADRTHAQGSNRCRDFQYDKGTIRSDIRSLGVSKDVRRHRLISIDYITTLPCHSTETLHR
jgi:hypothetical protein